MFDTEFAVEYISFKTFTDAMPSKSSYFRKNNYLLKRGGKVIMIYIGNFLHVTNQQENVEENRRHGGFNLIVEAENYEEATEKFKTQILKIRGNSEFFDGKCSIFFTQLFEFDTIPKNEAIMINYKSIAGDPIMPFIGCSVPTNSSDGCKIYNWQENVPEIEGKNEKVFMQFNG